MLVQELQGGSNRQDLALRQLDSPLAILPLER